MPIETDPTAAIIKARSRTLMAAKNLSRLMSEFEGELKYCGEAMTEVMDAADQLMALEAMQMPNDQSDTTPHPVCWQCGAHSRDPICAPCDTALTTADVWAEEPGTRVKAEPWGDGVILTIYDIGGSPRALKASIAGYRWKRILEALNQVALPFPPTHPQRP